MSKPKYQKLTQLEHVHKRVSMYGGVKHLLKNITWIMTGDKTGNLMEQQEIEYVPLWYKMFDEIISNSIDQFTRYPKQVKNIHVSFNKDTGTITIRNDGPAISVEQQDGVWIPEFVFCNFLAGENFGDDNARDTIGMNGIGSKLTNAFSSSFIIEVNDKDNGKHYVQEVKDCMKFINSPEITKSKGPSYTQITYTPDFAFIGYKKYTTSVGSIMEKLLYTRSAFASVYTGINVFMNGVEIPKISIGDLVRKSTSVDEDNILEFTLSKKNKPWDVCIAVVNDKMGFRQLSFVNGVVIIAGTHINHIINQLIEPFKDKIKKEMKLTRWNRNIVDQYLMIVVKAQIDGPEFEGQAKNELKSPDTFPEYKVPTAAPKKFYNMIKPFLEETYIQKNQDTSKKKKTRITAKKYTGAEKAGTAKSEQCTLFIPEGDSAELFVRKGITCKSAGLGGFMYNGIFNIQGKPVNARKNRTIKKLDGKNIIIRSDTLKNNERWNSLIDVLGLDYTLNYGPNQTKQFHNLRYGSVIISVDQDVDGVGHIFSLIINFFHVFWPELINRGYIRRLATPIIRAYPSNKKNKVLSFYTDDEYTNWCQETFNSLTPSGYKIDYFKGLAGHEADGTIDIFKHFTENVYKYSLDDMSDKLFESYLGVDTAQRKVELKTSPVKYVPKKHIITCSQHLQYELKEFQQCDILRSMPHLVDGLRPAARSVVAAGRNKFKSGNTPIKVFQFGGYVTENMNYHNGDTSLHGTIIKSAQDFSGAKNLPYLIGKGEFGDRTGGTNSHGAARYIKVCLNDKLCNAMFPPVDDFLLEYRYDDGERCEPLYYVPVLPTVIMETFCIPGTGWKTNIYARDYEQVIDNVRKLIIGDDNLDNMTHWIPFNESEVIEDQETGKIQIIGSYTEVKTDIIHINEMPPNIWSSQWRDKHIEDDNIDSILNNSTGNIIDITVKFKKDAMKTFKQNGNLDPVINYLKLYEIDTANLNVVDMKHHVREYKYYTDILHDWFEVRKNMYAVRIDRRSIQLTWLITMYKNLIRYADCYAEYKLSGKTKDAANKLLDKKDYVRINRTHLETPAYIKTDKLEAYILEDASYDYLLKLNDLDRLDIPNQKRCDKLGEFEKELVDLNKRDKYFKGARLWLKEIDAVEIIIKNAMKYGWDHGQAKANY